MQLRRRHIAAKWGTSRPCPVPDGHSGRTRPKCCDRAIPALCMASSDILEIFPGKSLMTSHVQRETSAGRAGRAGSDDPSSEMRWWSELMDFLCFDQELGVNIDTDRSSMNTDEDTLTPLPCSQLSRCRTGPGGRAKENEARSLPETQSARPFFLGSPSPTMCMSDLCWLPRLW